ncbi:glutaredoxin [Amniculicola lignicola CBS 123094]|uniref:Glutaredoxin n=1 Tax=Amniculicola lignicola CBS 123094 TaxID=1392246 RepID=A0A6A5VVW9_9PLEO|nr:glutaredoxin [Amniculicola lignicola CBS 123094]
MPSPRRVKVFGLMVLLTILITLYLTGSARQTRQSDFYRKTQESLEAREYEAAAKQRDETNVKARLKAAEDEAKKHAEEKGQKYLDSVSGERSVAGRVKMTPDEKDKGVPGVANVGGRPNDHEAVLQEGETAEDHEVELELNAILKKSPIIIFSKSYCPYSKKAKHILLNMYNINPAPFVVELDQHPLGAKLQETLAKSTGRRTVPNVLLMGKSIGGGDDIEVLHESRKLEDTIKSMGGSRIIDVTRTTVRLNPDMR